jgi:hypothetical protein
LRDAVGRFGRNAVDEREQSRFDEFDQPLEHLRLAGEMAVQRGLGDFEAARKRGGRDLFAARRFQHGGQRLQDLQPPLARFARHRLLPDQIRRTSRLAPGTAGSRR